MKDEKKAREQAATEVAKLRRRLKEAETELVRLKENQEQFIRSFMENSTPMAISTVDEGRYVYVNNAFITTLGIRKEDILGRTSMELGLLTREQRSMLVKELSRRDQFENYELQVKTKDGLKHGLMNTSRIRIAGKDHFLAVITDITGHKRIEQELRKSEEDFRAILDNMEEGYHRVDLKGNFTFTNRAFQKMSGYSADELIGMNYRSYAADRENEDRVFKAYNNVYRTGEPLRHFVWDIIRKDGARRTVAVSVSLLKIANSRPVGFAGIVTDVTDLKMAENQIALSRQNEEKYRILLDEIEDFYSEVDLEGNYTFCNDSFLKILGYAREEIVGTSYSRYCASEDQVKDLRRKYIKMYYSGEPVKRQEWEIVTRGGARRILEYNASVIRDHRGNITGFRGIGRDITERKVAEEQYRIVSNSLQGGVYIAQDEIISFVNPQVTKILGYSEKELIGRHSLDFVYPADRQMGRARSVQMLKGQLDAPFQVRLVDKKGNIKWAMVTVSSINYHGRQAVLGNFMDITIQKESESEKVHLQSMLIQAQKMESIGTLAGGIAHDFNNILGGMRGYTDLAKIKTNDVYIVPYLEQVTTACDRARDLVQQILTFSRQTEQEKRPIMLTPLIKEVLKFMRASLPSTIEIRRKLKVKSDLVMADGTQMHQLLMNLCMNAGYAMKGRGGVLEVNLADVDIDPRDSRHHLMESGRYLQLTVRDTGEGIEPGHLERIFEPYFTTKGKGEGTGLGLSVVDGIVKTHGGTIEIDSKVGEGSAFHVFLPLLEQPKVIDGSKGAAALPEGNETILFIDDEKMLANVSKSILEELGYRVFMETDPARALKLFRKEMKSIDLVFTDKTMPNLTGFDVAREVRKMRPDIPIIMCSGFQDKDDAEKISVSGINHFLVKPMKIEEIAQAIRDTLGKKS